jgi:hypothetical protein
MPSGLGQREDFEFGFGNLGRPASERFRSAKISKHQTKNFFITD